MQLFQHLILLRTSALLGPSEAARAANLDRVTLWRWEQGKRTPTYDQLATLLDLYNATPEQREAAESARKSANAI